MTDDRPFIVNLPELSDEAVVAIHDFFQDALDRFENQYFAQMHRYYRDIEAERHRYRFDQRQSSREPPTDDDPPF